MNDKDLIRAMRRMAVETNSLVCLGCGCEHSCSLHGCAIINKAVARLESLTGPQAAQAEKDGRLVVLPCKVGDTIYVIYHGRIVETKVRTFFLGHPSHRVEDRDMRMIRTTDFDISMDEVGKHIFLSCEEAEAALKKKENVK